MLVKQIIEDRRDVYPKFPVIFISGCAYVLGFIYCKRGAYCPWTHTCPWFWDTRYNTLAADTVKLQRTEKSEKGDVHGSNNNIISSNRNVSFEREPIYTNDPKWQKFRLNLLLCFKGKRQQFWSSHCLAVSKFTESNPPSLVKSYHIVHCWRFQQQSYRRSCPLHTLHTYHSWPWSSKHDHNPLAGGI